MSVVNRFTKIFKKDSWQRNLKYKESVSGSGSFLRNTENIRHYLPKIIKEFNIKSVLDLPCGDLNWIKEILPFKNTSYIGADCVKELIELNKLKYPSYDLRVLDIINDDLPKVDMIIVRDCLVHLSKVNIMKALDNISHACIKYLLVTSFPDTTTTKKISNGQWRRLNMELPEFNLTLKLQEIKERERGKYIMLFQQS